MAPSEPSRVFISYARKDGAALARRLQSNLETHGFDVWLDTRRIESGASFILNQTGVCLCEWKTRV